MASPRSTPIAASSDPLINGLLSGGGWIGSSIVWGLTDNPVEGLSWTNGNVSAAGIAPIIQTIGNVISVPITYGGWWTSFLGPALNIAITFTTPETYQLLGLNPNSDGGVVYPYTPSGSAVRTIFGFNLAQWPEPEGDIGLNINQQANFTNATPGSYGWFMGLYLGAAALGLKPPQSLGPSNFPTYSSLGLGEYDTALWTVLASSPTYNGVYPSTLMPGDIAALQYIYGANTNYLAGDTVHILANDGLVRAIYDAGGHDTLDGSSVTTAVNIDLSGASTVGAVTTVAIALSTIIEDARGGSGNDAIRGNDVANMLNGGAGDDTLNGGAGFDTLSFAGETQNTFAHFAWGYASGSDFLGANGANIGSDVFSNMEAVIGGSGNDVFISADSDNSLSGGEGSDWLQDIGTGNDTIFGGSGIDVLFGGEGNDSLDGGSETDGVFGEAGNDKLFGGLGDDWMEGGAGADSLVGGDDADVLIGNDDNDTAIGGIGNDALSGGAGDDSLDGGDGNDWITGEAGSDTMNGGAGIDAMFGDAGANVYNAGDGNDGLTGGGDGETMNGEAGDDYIQGWGGADTITGGAGSDTFVYQIPSDSTQAGPDRITDYDGAIDWLNLGPIDANWATGADEAFTLAAAPGDGLAKAVPAFAAGVTTLSLYMNGDATADMVITFTGDVTGNTSHFVL